jgi:hypothetical protein
MAITSKAIRSRWLQFSLGTLFVGIALLTPFLAWYSAQLRWMDARLAELDHFHPSVVRFGPAPTFGLRFIRQHGFSLIVVQVDSDEDEARAHRLHSVFPEAEIRIERAR